LIGFEPTISSLGGMRSIQLNYKGIIFKVSFSLKKMLLKVLGIFDIVAGLILILDKSLVFSDQILITFGIILLAKSSLGLLKNLASWIDFLAGVILLLSIIINIPIAINFILGVLIIQKGIFSLL
tara:strand:- start:1951 stop:2325 length:375 start_codon:yes stop_codon:yes gene_type:complete